MIPRLSAHDIECFEHAVQLARFAAEEGNLPIGAVISLKGEIVGEGRIAIWHPKFDPSRHAEMEALRAVPVECWPARRELILYTTLEPCLMCLGAILLHSLGSVMFGALDSFSGASLVWDRLPPYFASQAESMSWVGPAYEEVCNELFDQVMRKIELRDEGGG